MRDEYTIDAYAQERDDLRFMRRKESLLNEVWLTMEQDLGWMERLISRLDELDERSFLGEFLEVDTPIVNVALQACEVQEAIQEASYENAGEYADEMIKEFKGEFKEGMEEHLKIMIERGMITNGQREEFQDYFRWYVYE
jgi:hypothetical protein